MALTNLDGIFAGLRQPIKFNKAATGTIVAGKPQSLWALNGSPGAGSYDNTLNGVVLNSSTTIPNGAIPHWDPVTGNSNLAFFEAVATQNGVLELRDRLWHNGGYSATSTAAQNSTTPTWPSRCPTSGTDDTPATTGHGVLLALEVSAAAGAGTPTITCGYTNSAGTASRSAVNINPVVASSVAGSIYDIGLQAGDLGVRSLQSMTLSATMTSGTINMVAYRVLARLSLLAGTSNCIDSLTGAGVRLYNGVVPWLVFYPSAVTTTFVNGTYIESQG